MAGRTHDARDIFLHGLGYANPFSGFLQLGDLFGCRYGFQLPQRIFLSETLQDGDLLLLPGITQPQAQQEPVELRFRQGKGSLEFDRILRGHDEKRMRQAVCFPVHGHLTLFHAFQEARLCPGYGSVDLVG